MSKVELVRRLASSDSESGPSQASLLVSAVRHVYVGIPAHVVIETMRPLPVRRLGDAPRFVVGVAGVRGQPTPVFDLGAMLGLGDTERAGARWVTVEASGPVALQVDNVVGLQRLGPGACHELPPLLDAADTAMVASLGQRDGRLLVVLREGRLVPAELVSALRQGNDA